MAVINFDQEDCNFVYGFRYFGLSITRNAKGDKFQVSAHAAYENKSFASDNGFRWDSRAKAWCADHATLELAANFIKRSLEDQRLVAALACDHEGEEVPCYVLPALKNAFIRSWVATVAGVSPLVPAQTTEKTESSEDLVIDFLAPDRAKVTEKIVAIKNSDGAITHLAFKVTYNPSVITAIKWLCDQADCKAIWRSDKKMWLLPIEAVSVLNTINNNSANYKIFDLLSEIQYYSDGALQVCPFLMSWEKTLADRGFKFEKNYVFFSER